MATRESHEIRERENMSKVIYPEESYAIVGACFNVYNKMGCGFLEAVYHECTEIELTHQKIPFQSQYECILVYQDQELRQRFRLDLVCYEKIILEIKAVSTLLGILINFGHYPKLRIRTIYIDR